MTYLLGKRFNDFAKKWGNKAYDGLGDILTKEINIPKKLAVPAAALAFAGCASMPLTPADAPVEEKKAEESKPLEEKITVGDKPVSEDIMEKKMLPDGVPSTFAGSPISPQAKPKPEVKKAEKTQRNDFIGEAFNLKYPSFVGVQGGQSFVPESGHLYDEHANKEIMGDVFGKLSDDLLLRIYGYEGFADNNRNLKAAGKYKLENTILGIGGYTPVTEDESLLAGVIAEVSRQRFRDASKNTETGFAAGLSLRYADDKWRIELNAMLGQNTGDYKDGSRFLSDIFQANANASLLLSEKSGTVIKLMANYGSSHEGQNGTPWHLTRDGRAAGIGVAQRILKGKGQELAVQAMLYGSNYDIGPHVDLDSVGASGAIIYRLTPATEEGKEPKWICEGFIEGYTEQSHTNAPLPGQGKSGQSHGVRAGARVCFPFW
ncbi:hypothetical protein KY317_01245 [Candidatus Woesearchaeota archaeon]|nr:hypothetical protein [Candidatus Woesearchaeota archaeon]